MKNKTQSSLIENNNVRLATDGVWSSDVESEFLYTDGDSSEDSLKTILARAKDRSSVSLELEAASYDWISNYHLSSERANIYRFLDLSEVGIGLELGSGCGAITRYLGEQGLRLDAIEGNKRRAEICRLRCDELENVQVIHSNFNDLLLPENTYDAVFLNGVLEYAKKFLADAKDDREALLEILKRSQSALNAEGVTFIAIENRMGLKYWMGAREDHFNLPHVGLYNYPNDQGIRTYDRIEWKSILEELGSEYHHRFIYPFPDYKMARAILSEEFIRESEYAHSHLYRLPSMDNGVPVQGSMNEFLLWESFKQNSSFEQFANSFFILISKNKDRLRSICPYDFMHFSGKGRKPGFRTLTSKKRGENVVEKRNILPVVAENNKLLHHDLTPAPYVQGPLLVSRWIHALLDDDSGTFDECVKDYYEYLLDYWTKNDNLQNSFDLLPFNIIIDSQGSWEAIDKEWVVNVSLSPEYLLFRALFWFPAGNESLLHSFLVENNISTLKEFIDYYFQLLSLSLEDSIEEYIANEELLQTQITDQIRANPIQNSLLQPLQQNSASTQADAFLTQLYWSGDLEDWSEDKSVFEPGKMGLDAQSISFKLPPINNIGRLRFDPADRAGFFRLHHLQITPIGDGDFGSETGWNVIGNEKIAQAATLQNIEYCKNGLGDLCISTGNDPSFVFTLPGHVKGWIKESGVQVTVVMDWPKSTDYLVAMDTLGKRVVQQEAELKRLSDVEEHGLKQAERISQQASRLKETSDQVRAKDIYIENIEKEIEAMRQTRVWKIAEYLRMKLYYRLLDTKNLARKSLSTLRQEGPRQFLRKVKQHVSSKPDAATLGLNRPGYDLWVEHTRLTDYDIEELKTSIKEFEVKPLFSILVPVYNVDQEWLERTIDSVRMQLYENWELCLCDDLSPSPHVRKVLQQYADLDSRIKVLFKEKNEGIALTTNSALSMATGDYIGLLDHDDELTINALYENAKVINENPGVGLIYSDEDKLDMQGRRCDPFFKPDYSPELIKSQNYICHFTVIKKSIVDELKGFRKGYDGSQDHDIILRSLEKTTKVHHIPKVLYHWRKIPGSTAAVYDSKSYAWEAGRKAIEDSLHRIGGKGEVALAKFQGCYRVKNAISENPLVTIIIPFKDKKKLLGTVVDSILDKTTYQNYEILGISNNSDEQDTFRMMESLTEKDPRVRFIEYNVPFNFSDINNHAVDLAKGEYVVLLNNDIEVISPEWLEALLEFAQLPEIGAVGGKLYYPDDRIQHAGIVIGMAGVAGPPHYLFHRNDVGYYARAHVIHNVSAVTGACLMVDKKLYKAAGGMDTENFGVAFNDIDFCLKLLKKGYRNVFTPYCEMYHFESQSRGYEDTPEKLERLERESAVFRDRWEMYFQKGDPYFSPHLSLEKTNFSIKIA